MALNGYMVSTCRVWGLCVAGYGILAKLYGSFGHIGIIIGYDMLAQVCGSFGPQGQILKREDEASRPPAGLDRGLRLLVFSHSTEAGGLKILRYADGWPQLKTCQHCSEKGLRTY